MQRNNLATMPQGTPARANVGKSEIRSRLFIEGITSAKQENGQSLEIDTMMPSLVALLLLIAAGLVVCSALFTGLETALFALRRHQLRRLESNHPALAGFVQEVS